MHDMMVDVLRQSEAARIADVRVTFRDDDDARAFTAADDKIAYFIETDRAEIARRITVNQVVIPLYSDMLHFLYEGLIALEKRKYAVAFTMLRKPLKYGLLFATWLWADQDDFYAKMAASPADHMDDRKITKERRMELLRASITALGEDGSFCDAGVLYGVVFDRNNNRGLAQFFDKAAHLVTSHPAMRTEQLNLNFIFKSPKDTDVYEGVYYWLAYLMMYLLLIQARTFGRMMVISETYVRWAFTSMLGTFEALFSNGDGGLFGSLNDAFGTMLICVACRSQMSITRENAARVLVAELIGCTACGQEQQFPLFWLMSQAGVATLPAG